MTPNPKEKGMTEPPSIVVDPATGQVIQIGDFAVDRSMLESPEQDEFLPAFAAAKAEFDKIRKDKDNPFFNTKYADLEGVQDATFPALRAHGLMLLGQTFIDGQGRNVLWTRVIHVTSKQWIGSLWVLRPIKQDPQAEGSALTYARRYQAQLILGVTSVDDDGAQASQGAPGPSGGRQQRPAANQRNWLAEGKTIAANKRKPAATRRAELIAHIESCEKAHAMTPQIKRDLIDVGKKLAAEIEQAATG